jgi:hypothetical protein
MLISYELSALSSIIINSENKRLYYTCTPVIYQEHYKDFLAYSLGKIKQIQYYFPIF